MDFFHNRAELVTGILQTSVAVTPLFHKRDETATSRAHS